MGKSRFSGAIRLLLSLILLVAPGFQAKSAVAAQNPLDDIPTIDSA